MSRLKQLIREVHRRSLWQVLGVYLAGSWVVLQVVETLADSVGLPDWFPPVAFGLLLVGLPIVVATAFVQEGVGAKDRGRGASGDAARAAGNAASTADAEPSGTRSPGPGDFGASDVRAGPRHGLFTWRNALLGGVVAFALLGLATAGYMAMRTLGIGPAGTLVARGLIEQGERVILADFENLTRDSLLGEVVTETFRVDLAQTPVVSLAEPAYVADVLGRMERPADTRLDAELAREVAIREGIQAVIAGEVGTAGGAYVLTARVLTAEAGEQLASLRETAADSSEIVSAIDELSEGLRERLGESLRSLRAGEPLARVTTGSLEALRKYSQAVTAINRGEGNTGRALLEEALEIDSTFAMAWRKLATVVSGERQVEAARRAYELRDRLTDRERYHTIGIYESYVNRDFEAAATAFRTLLDTHADDGLALHNLSISYQWMGDLERALDASRRARDVGYAGVDPYWRTLRWSWELGRFQEARAALARLSEDRPDHPVTAREQWAVALLDGDLETARAAASRRLDHDVRAWRNGGRVFLARLELSRGRLTTARPFIEALQGPSGLELAIDFAEHFDLHVRGDTAGARRRVAAALERAPAGELDLLDRYQLVRVHARTGRVPAARSLLREIEPGLDSLQRHFPWIPRSRVARSEILTAEGRYAEAIEELRAYERGRAICDAVRCNVEEKAWTFDRAGERDSAIAYYERFVEPEHYGRVFAMHRVPPTYLRLGELHDEAGDLESAAKYYARFVEMWAEADEELQARVRAARQRLEEIVRERG